MEQGMTDAYKLGFMTKCAEHGVPAYVANCMMKSASRFVGFNSCRYGWEGWNKG